MPRIDCSHIGVAIDMRGCPNRCRHCYGGLQDRRQPRMNAQSLRKIARLFREYIAVAGGPIKQFSLMSWGGREPDFSPSYRRWAELEAELGDGKPARFELLSIWRLARDRSYAPWAKSVGTNICQITFFGMSHVQDWFYRRKGAFQDCLVATQRLLDAGIIPRWQLFLTKKILPDLDGLMRLIDRLELREKVAQLGGEFDIFLHPPCLIGEARNIAHLSVRLRDIEAIPSELRQATLKHFKEDRPWETEAEAVDRILGSAAPARPFPWPLEAGMPWFVITGNWDVFTNLGTNEPWWRLGNLNRDSLSTIIGRFEQDEIPALKLNTTETLRQLALERRRDADDTVVSSIERYWFECFCEREYGGQSV